MPLFRSNSSSHRSFALRYAGLAVICFCLTEFVRPALPATITDLGTLGGSSSAASGINASGQIVGSSTTTGSVDTHAFLYAGGSMTDLGTFGGSSSAASGINASGQIVGSAAITGSVFTHAFLYAGGSMTDLGTLGGPNSTAAGINDSGQIVGASLTTGDGPRDAFLYSGGTMTAISFGSDGNGATGINASGQVVGYGMPLVQRYSHESISHAFSYSGGSVTDIDPFNGLGSRATGINASGQIVLDSYTETGIHAFLYSGGSVTDLGTLGGDQSYSGGINASGQVVGNSRTSDPGYVYHAFLYSAGSMTDLNSLLPIGSGWNLVGASGINDSGQIVGGGFINGQFHAFLLNTSQTDSPEPASLALLGIGLVAGGLRQRWRSGKFRIFCFLYDSVKVNTDSGGFLTANERSRKY